MNGLNTINANAVFTDTLEVNTLAIDTQGTAPTRPSGDNSTNIATTAYVDNATTGSFVTLNTTQTITGQKTFSNANTYITGNTVTDSIRSSSATTPINIGQNIQSGAINLGTTFIGPTMSIPLNWGTSSNTGTLNFFGGSFNLTSSGIYTQRCGATFGMTLGDTQTTGVMSIATRSDRSGVLNISNGVNATNDIRIGNQRTGAGAISIGSTASTTQTCDMNAVTTFSKIPSCAVVPTTGDHLTNKTYVDSAITSGGTGFVTLATNQSITGVKTFTSNIIAGAGIIPSTGVNLALTTTGGEDILVTGSNDITFNSTSNTVFNAGLYGSFSANAGYTFVNNGSAGFIFNDNALAGGQGLKLTSFYNDIVNTSVNNYDYNTATFFSPAYAQPNRGGIYNSSSTAINPALSYTNGTQTDSGAIFTAMTVTAPANNTCNMVSVKIAFDLIAWATFGLPAGSGTIGLQFNSYTISILKNGSAYTPAILNHFSNATGTTQNFAKSGTQSNIQGMGAYFGTIDAVFNLDLNNATADTYAIRITPTMTITNYSINFDGFKFSCRASTSGGTNGNPFFTGVRLSYTGGTMAYSSVVPTFVDSSITRLATSYPTPANVNACFMPLNNNITPAGMIASYVVATPPAGWLVCDGTSYSISTYPNLYAVIGNTFGGTFATGVFSVPDFEGAFLRGAGSQTVGGVTYTANAVGTPQQDQVLTSSYATNNGFRSCGAGTRDAIARFQITTDPVDTTGILAQFSRQGTENRPMNYSVYYIIKY
jgi:microcystin-dependent protein